MTRALLAAAPAAAGFLWDIDGYNPATNAWSTWWGPPTPPTRLGPGFAAMPDGILYLFGGDGIAGEDVV